MSVVKAKNVDFEKIEYGVLENNRQELHGSDFIRDTSLMIRT